FVNGDPTLWQRHTWQGEDATLMGEWGAYEKGGRQVDPRYDWASARFSASGAKVRVEYLSREVSENLAYTVSIERSEVRLVNADQPARMALRVTHLFRKEGGGWKLVHRHADPLTGKTAPTAVVQK
ncbi:MAG: nuclear transport factor 2 family protein, partial [Ferruginibacter sp.]|nr:nuclear transport factor 2 family protein [Cytophagales bacterium]